MAEQINPGEDPLGVAYTNAEGERVFVPNCAMAIYDGDLFITHVGMIRERHAAGTWSNAKLQRYSEFQSEQ